jgi:hypothetical protein
VVPAAQTQPVTTFALQRNLAANPIVNETDDTAIGSCANRIMLSLWGATRCASVAAGPDRHPRTGATTTASTDTGNGNGLVCETRDVRPSGFAGAGTV